MEKQQRKNQLDDDLLGQGIIRASRAVLKSSFNYNDDLDKSYKGYDLA